MNLLLEWNKAIKQVFREIQRTTAIPERMFYTVFVSDIMGTSHINIELSYNFHTVIIVLHKTSATLVLLKGFPN